MSPREAKQLAPAHTGSECWSQDSNPGSPGTELVLLITKPPATRLPSII